MPDPLLGQIENYSGPVVTIGGIELIDNSVFVRLSAGSNLDVLIYKEGHRLDLCIYCLLVAFPAVPCLSDKSNMTLEASRWAGGPKVQARGLISKSRRPGRVQSIPLSHTILEMTKFVCAAIPAEIILLFRKIQNTKQIDFKLSTGIVSAVNRRLLVEENFLKFLKFFSVQSCSTMGVEGVSVKFLARPVPHIPPCHQGHN